MELYKRILLAVDFSMATDMLAERAADLSRRCGAQLTLLHVVEPIIIDPSYDVFPALPLGLEQDLIDKARDELGKLGQRMGVDASQCHVVVGSTKTEILQFARGANVDLIMVGSHGRRGVALLLGSTANAVLHGAPCDVLAVRIH